MSSTRVRERRGKHVDFYETPAYVVEGLLSKNVVSGSRLLEPSAGKGAIIRSLADALPELHTTGVEIQPRFRADLEACCDHTIIGDFLTVELKPEFDLVVANPPFSQAGPFIERSLDLLTPSGLGIFLLRLPFIASVKRAEFFKDHRPSHVFVLTQRPKFGGDNIDSCDYAWFVWSKAGSDTTILDWIWPKARAKKPRITSK